MYYLILKDNKDILFIIKKILLWNIKLKYKIKGIYISQQVKENTINVLFILYHLNMTL